MEFSETDKKLTERNDALECDSDDTNVQTHQIGSQTASSGDLGAGNEGVTDEALDKMETRAMRDRGCVNCVHYPCADYQAGCDNRKQFRRDPASSISDVLILTAEVRRLNKDLNAAKRILDRFFGCTEREVSK